MIKAGQLKLCISCARGEFRGPEASALVPESEFVEGGYVGIHTWLRGKDELSQVKDLLTFYSGCYMVLIADKPDLDSDTHAAALRFVSELLVKANIPYKQTDFLTLLKQIGDHAEIDLLSTSL